MNINKGSWFELTEGNIAEVREQFPKIESCEGGASWSDPFDEDYGSVIGARVRSTESRDGASVVFVEYDDSACMVRNGVIWWGDSEANHQGQWLFEAEGRTFDEDGNELAAA